MKGIVLDDVGLLLDEDDDVATAIDDLEAGRTVSLADHPDATVRRTGPVTLVRDVPFGHKVALVPVEADEPVVKYGERIGRATAAIAPGEWVHTHNCESTRGRGDLSGDRAGADASTPVDDEGDVDVAVTDAGGSLDAGSEVDWTTDTAVGDDDVDAAATFAGYRRPDGRLGVRNRVLVLPSVICSSVVAESIAGRTDRAVAAPHDHGCGQLGVDNAQTEAVLRGVAANPNVAGTLVVGLGCEEVQSDAVAGAVADRGLPVREVAIQDAGGTDACIEAGATAARELAAHADAATAADGSLGELTLGIVGDLADSTVERADPLVAGLVDRVVAAGGRVAVAGSERFVAHPGVTRSRATAEARPAVEALVERHAGQPARARRVATAAAERGPDAALGLLGDRPIREVVPYGEGVTVDSGVALVDAPSRFEEAATALAAAGAHVVVHVTADGDPAGHPIVPVVKVSGDAATLAALPDDVDVDARRTDATDLARRLVAVADGESAAAERHGLASFAVTRVGPSM